jgi:RNA polymerase sigma-70 factor (ECF subfamily)
MGPTDFTRLYAEHAQSLYAFLSYRTGDRVLAEDLLADTFERVLRSRRGYDRRRGSERTWLYTIALNCVRDNARRAAAESRALANARADGVTRLSVPAASDEIELKAMLDDAMASLSDEEREVLALRFGADLSLADIAAVVGEPRSTVETRIYRGLRKMRSLVDEASRPATEPLLKRAGEA